MKRRNATPVSIDLAVDNVLHMFPMAEIEDPLIERDMREGHAAEQKYAEQAARAGEARAARHEYAELVRTAQTLSDYRYMLNRRLGGEAPKRTFYLMQCLDCSYLWIGSSGAKGWGYPSARAGSCAPCTGATQMTRREMEKHRDERTRIVRTFKPDTAKVDAEIGVS